ncbi:pirin family protein [Vibrio profundum]|uniref:pirin family protein n=1 Tax=Vibrio profundum TaxID=2910247 RepID=UPI003D0FB287
MMNHSELKVINKSDISLGGFAGIVETRMVMSPNVWPEAGGNPQINHGLGDFIYLANGYFKPNEGVPIHPHRDIDIVSLMLSGTIGHKGTLGDGTVIQSPGVQVQRAGTGMEHSEFNVTDVNADIIQMWFLPPEQGLTPDYKDYKLSTQKMTTVLGGDGNDTFDSNMVCQVGFVGPNEQVVCDVPFIALVTQGQARANMVEVREGDLIQGDALELSSEQGIGLVLIYSN